MKDPQDNTVTYVVKIEDISYQLRTMEERVSDSIKITKILLILLPNLNHFANAWESLSEKQKTLANLMSRLTLKKARTNI